MKKLLITAFAATLFTASFGQSVNDLEFRLLNPAPSTNQGGIFVTATYTIKNNGPLTLMAGDTIFGAFVIPQPSGNILVDDFSFILGANLAVGDSLNNSINQDAGIIYPTTAVSVNVCGFAYAQESSYIDTGANFSNNVSCYTWNVSQASVDEITLKENTKVFVANGMLNLASTSTENITFTVMSINGQVVSQGNFVSNKQVDLNGMAKGIYAVVLSNGTEKVTKKVAIQ